SLTNASERHSPLRFIAAERLRGRVERRARGGVWGVGFLLFTVYVFFPFVVSLPPPPRWVIGAPPAINCGSKLVRLLECGRRQKAQHTTHNVGIIVVTVARVLDRVLAASMRAPLKQTQLVNEPRIVGQPR